MTSGEERRRLVQGLALNEGFQLDLLLLGSSQHLKPHVQQLLEEVGALRGEEITPVELSVEDPASPGPLLRRLLEPRVPSGASVVVVDLVDQREAHEPAWRALFRRLNEQRNAVVQRGVPLWLALSPWQYKLFVESAPDFWSLRTTVAELEAEASGAALASQELRWRSPLPRLRVLHLSQLCFSPRRSSWAAGVVESIAQALAGEAPDLVVFSGDMVQGGSARAFDGALGWWEDLMNRISVSPAQVFWCPGEQDKDPRTPGLEWDALERQLSYYEDRERALRPFALYREASRGFFGPLLRGQDPAYGCVRVLDIQGERVGVASLNVAFSAEGAFLGEHQVQQASQALQERGAALKLAVLCELPEGSQESGEPPVPGSLRECFDVVLCQGGQGQPVSLWSQRGLLCHSVAPLWPRVGVGAFAVLRLGPAQVESRVFELPTANPSSQLKGLWPSAGAPEGAAQVSFLEAENHEVGVRLEGGPSSPEARALLGRLSRAWARWSPQIELILLLLSVPGDLLPAPPRARTLGLVLYMERAGRLEELVEALVEMGILAQGAGEGA